ncbi:MAG: hypothetical protein JNM31_03915 [Flavobacteriales bacterium]|nr:hypothetical protein [Flavobacteriales bacterium]
MPLLYDLAAGAYFLGIRAAAPFHGKARQWAAGRDGLWARLEAAAPRLQGCLWMHCASVGEFEQGRPVLEALHAAQPQRPILLTFFSPSGYEARKDHPLATHVEYLPEDTAANAQRLVKLVNPSAALFVKYEFWFHHLRTLQQQHVPTYLVSAVLRPDQPFFRWYGSTWRRMLQCYTHILAQDEATRALLAGLDFTNVTVSGDTRFDRVAAIMREGRALPLGQAYHRAMDAPVLIAGSSWPADEDLLVQVLGRMRRPPRVVVVPHEPSEAALQRAADRFPKPVERWSRLEAELEAGRLAATGHAPPDEDPLFARTLLVDRMGILARLYQHADVAYVGGGFSDGIHSILEAAAWGRPVIFGPKHTKFPEAQALIDAGAGFCVRDADELRTTLNRLFGDREYLAWCGEVARRFVQERTRATQRAVEVITGANS